MSIPSAPAPPAARAPTTLAEAAPGIAEALVARHGPRDAERIRRGVRQVAERWWPEDGSAADLASFCRETWLPDEDARERLFARLEEVLEQVDGHLHEIHRELQRPTDLDLGPLDPVDLMLQRVDLAAHVDEDLFRTRVAFHALLHLPVHTLEERLRGGPGWTRAEWARSRLMDRFAERVPPPILQEITRALRTADLYISEYNISMGSLLEPDGSRPFPEGLRLISHWGLREELRSHYGRGAEGHRKQRLIRTVMERIVRQEIPAAIRNADGVAWCPETNEISRNGVPVAPAPEGREPDTRYAHLLSVFHALRAADPYAPAAPTFIRRRFEQGREIPEEEAERLIRSVLEAPEVDDLTRRIESRLGRPLEPFDVWYPGYMPRASRSEEELDRVVRERFPTAGDFQRALPDLLEKLGFTSERSAWLADRIVVDASRGAGHALGAVRRGDRSRLRTRATGGMTYKSFDTAAHELGHCVEQVFSLDAIDHWSLSGVPNTAFTEAFAFTFQDRGLELLGDPSAGEEERRRDALEALWSTFEIAGVSLVDMRLWRWMYAHPDASKEALREATVDLARGVWNEFFAPRFGARDSEILAIYSHLIESALYTPDYALGRIIAFQIAPRLRSGDFGLEVERMTTLGRLTPEAWMRAATGTGLSAEPLLEEARAALRHAG